MSSIRKKIGRSRLRARWLEQRPAPILLHSSESIRGVTLAYFPFVLSRKEYAEARKSRRCREAERLAQAQVQTTPPWSKAGRSEMKHHSWCCPRLATPFTCLVSCSIHPRVPSTSLQFLHPRWYLLMYLYDVTFIVFFPIGAECFATTSLRLMKLRVDDDSMDPADSSVAIIMRQVCILHFVHKWMTLSLPSFDSVELISMNKRESSRNNKGFWWQSTYNVYLLLI